MRDRVAEQALVERLRSGEGSAVRDLAEAYGSKIYQLAFRQMRNREDAEELTQDVLLRVFQKIHAFRGDAALSSWIYRITFNAAMARLRSLRINQAATIGQDDGFEAGDSDGAPSRPREIADWSRLADDAVMRSEVRKKLVAAMLDLPTIYRVPVLLRDVKGLSTEEATAVLRINPQTLKSRTHRGRLILRERLAEFADGLSLRHAA